MGARTRRTACAAVVATVLVAAAPIGSAAVTAGASGTPGAGPAASATTWRHQIARLLKAKGDQAGLRALAANAGPASDASLRADGAVSAAAAPTIAVTPATNLRSGDAVTVTGTGWTDALGGLPLLECTADAVDFTGCDTGSAEFAQPDPAGAFSTTVPVRRLLRTLGNTIDCATDACVMAGLAPATGAVVAGASIAFDPAAPLPAPTLTVLPTTGLLAGQEIAVSGTGWLPGDDVIAEVCAVEDQFCGHSGVYRPVSASGTFTGSLTVSLRVVDGNGELSDCLTVACEVRAADVANSDYAATTAISFDPSQPHPAPPVITVTPHTGLLHDQVVTVEGTGFEPGGFVDLGECPDSGFGADICFDSIAEADADATGAFSTEVRVSRLTRTVVLNFPDITEETVDCVDVGCVIHATGYAQDENLVLEASAPIEFDASAPPPALPGVTAAPTTALPYRATVTVTGDGFAPGEEVVAEFCANGDFGGTCASGDFVSADPSGHAVLQVPVRRKVSTFAGGEVVDCADPTATCALQVQGARSYETWTFPLAFDPNAPVPPAPTATATPDRDLGYRQNVTLSAQGLTPGPATIAECTDVSVGGEPGLSYPRCVYDTAPLVVAADGTLTTTFSARRILTQGFGAPVDCSTGIGKCYLRVGASAGIFDDPLDSARVDLGFDPNSTPPPPPPVTVDPHTGLHDGQTVHVHGSGFDANASIGVTTCAADTTSLDGCDLQNSRIVQSDAEGVIDTDYVVHAQVPTNSTGPLDCTAAPGACVIGVANIADYLQYSLTPLEFSVPDIELHSVTVTEGTGGVTAAPVPIEISEPAPGPITVTWAADPGSATGADFTATAGTVVIPAGATEAVIPAEVVADALDEPTERFTVRIVSATGAHVTDGDATVKIRDDDAEPEVNVGDWHATEGDGVAYTLVGLSTPSGRAVTVEWRTHHDSARSDRDFERTRGEIDFAPGQQWAVIAVPLVDDAVGEPTERFRIELRDADDAEVGDGDAWITVADDD